MKSYAALYPFCAELLSVVRNFDKLQDTYTLTKLYAQNCISMTGKDVAYICNQSEIGKSIENGIVYDDPSWEVLLLTHVEDKALMKSVDFVSTIECALLAGKSVVFYCKDNKDIISKLSELKQTFSSRLTVVNNVAFERVSGSNIPYVPLEVPVVLVGGLIREADTTEVLLSLTARMRVDGLRVLTLSNLPMSITLGLTYLNRFEQFSAKNTDRITMMKKLIREYEHLYRPDIILIEAPDAVMAYSDNIPNGYGVDTYLLCQAIRPDYFVCCVPFNLAYGKLLSVLSQNFIVRLGTPINVSHTSNVFVDTTESLHHELTHIYLNNEMVQERLRKEKHLTPVPMFDAIGNGVEGIYKSLCAVMKK